MARNSINKTRIAAVFGQLRLQGKKAFIPYLMAGDPTLDKTMEQVLLMERCGADIIELGVPFSDPLADGPTIQKAAVRALSAGTTLRKVISLVKELRVKTGIPLVLMTYYNLILKYGEAPFVKDALNAGIDGVIIPDLPPEEAQEFTKQCRARTLLHQLDTIFLVAPTSTPARIKKITSASSGFVYYVSLTGITGSKLEFDEALRSHMQLVKQTTDKPVAAGFGVATADDARSIAQIADGVIVGSAIVKVFNETPEKAESFLRELRKAI